MMDVEIEREVLIHARPATVFAYFRDPDRFAAWFGAGSSIDARPGGAVRVVFPGGAEATGQVREVEDDRRIVFTWGYPRPDTPLAPGGSTVEIVLDEVADGTRVRLRHVLPTRELADQHVAGWRHHLSHLTALATHDERSGAADLVTRWDAAWRDPDARTRGGALDALVADDVEVVDDLVAIVGADELAAHIGNLLRHLPGATIARDGDVRATADLVTWPWAMATDAGVVGTGRWVVTVDLDGRIRRAVGFWDDDPDLVSRRVHGMA